MSSVLIRRHLDSARLDLPELQQFVGMDVEISVREAPPAATPDRWQALDAIAGLDLIDPEALRDFDAADLRSRAEAERGPG